MKRMHIFEFEDQFWCPSIIRDTITELLQIYINKFDIYLPIFDKIRNILKKNNLDQIVDIGSGGGGVLENLKAYLDENQNSEIKIILTDKYPNIMRFSLLEKKYKNSIKGIKYPIEANYIPEDLIGMRTLFTVFHHFKPYQANQILQDAISKNMPIGIFEFTERNLISIIRMFFSPFIIIFIFPFLRPFSIKKMFWTYIFPVIPLVATWDGIISNLRTYTPKELQELVDQLDAPNYRWEIGQAFSKKALCRITYLIGYQADAA